VRRKAKGGPNYNEHTCTYYKNNTIGNHEYYLHCAGISRDASWVTAGMRVNLGAY